MQAPDPTTLALAANALRLKEIETVKKSTSGKFNNNNNINPLLNLAILDPYSPWNTLPNAFRLNNINSKTFSFTFNDESYDIVASANAQKPELVDLEVKKGNESIKKFTAVDSHFDQEGLLVSCIDNKQVKSNVVLHNENVVVFDEVSCCFSLHQNLNSKSSLLVWSHDLPNSYT